MTLSAWLNPEEKHFGQLQELINRLAQENNSPTFIPHCTLVGEIILDSNFSFDEIDIFCAQANPITLNVSKIMSEKTLFKSLYIQLKKEKIIVNFQEKLANFFINREPYKFDPHLSLMYKIVSAEKQKKIISCISLPDQINFNYISIVNTGQNVDEWKIVQTQKLFG